MAGTFTLGETKVRPGSYFNIQKNGGSDDTGIMNGVTAVLFRADFGPLNTVVELDADDGYEQTFGTGLTTDAIGQAIAGGAKTIIACRVGSGGSKGRISLNDADGEEALRIMARYPGDRGFMVTLRDKISNPARKECIFYSGTSEVEKLEFPSGEGEAKALADALSASSNFEAELKEGKDRAQLAPVFQDFFEDGENPQATAEDYSNALAQVESYEYNTICLDTEDMEIHLMLQAFLSRIYAAGSLAQAVVAEKHTIDLEERMMHAAGFNDEKMNYVLNAWVAEQGMEIDGYQTAARIAGMIGSASSGTSLTHAVTGFSEILERLTNTAMVAAEEAGCIVLSHNSKKQVWIDNAINTLVSPAERQDEGWKKIRRVTARFELVRRISVIMEELMGSLDNDANGRATALSLVQGVGDSMVEEGKLVSCSVEESGTYEADTDSAWFDIDVVDKDSIEHVYLSFRFQFSTSEG